MSRAFRDTFKQTLCFCQKLDRRQSTISFAQIPILKHQQRHLNQSVAYDTVTTYKSSEDYRTTLAPIIKSLNDSTNKKKKRTTKALQFLNHTNSILS
jgi:hypothetical protein